MVIINFLISRLLIDQEDKKMNSFSHVPPGFRFHPTDEELVDYYLRKKVASKRIEIDFIKDIDLYKIEPWDLLGLPNHIIFCNFLVKFFKLISFLEK